MRLKRDPRAVAATVIMHLLRAATDLSGGRRLGDALIAPFTEPVIE